jgi:hypothetical protein
MDDLEFLRARLPGYRDYESEDARHDSDMRVRAFLGERLSEVQSRDAELDTATRNLLDASVLRCAFTDQAFVKKFEHANLDAATLAALLHADRALVELGERLATCAPGDLGALLGEIAHALDERPFPAPAAAS